MGRELEAFKDKGEELKKEWHSLFGGYQEEGPSPVGRAPKGKRTPESEFRIPILESLVELGGRAPTKEVLKKVEEKMKGILTEIDYGRLPKSGQIRWVNTAKWCRKYLVQIGALKKDSPLGIWEITEKGREMLGL
ncbi:winged helix-turn-helix domain-containing protein [bacterium]|nr:winged helix-turn-helix domain-containing protein [bacterium]